ncbi:unnamed protein product [Prunus armeniaca]|uniref:Uncharacterized protein n=1 Tax=Prunus armeniaca TaxID=36596 RepID=A0A6J5UWF6_PRUAR|nr:unnamed protein product [Prunus armeniaca]
MARTSSSKKKRLLQRLTLSGKDILKKSERKNRFLFSFRGLLAPIGGGKIRALKNLGTKNPVLYLDFPLGRMKLFGTIVPLVVSAFLQSVCRTTLNHDINLKKGVNSCTSE